MDQYFVVSSDGREFGPVDLPGLLQWVREGRVLKTTLIRKNGGDPVPAEAIPEVAVVLAPPPPMALPPVATSVNVPEEFRSWEFIGQAWELIKPHWLPMAAMFVILAAAGMVPYAGACALFIVGGAIYVGIGRAILGLIAGRPPKVEMMFGAFDRFGQAFLASLVVGLLVAIGSVFLIVPGIIMAIMWMFVYLVMAETDLDFWPAMQASADLATGHWWDLFCLMMAGFVVMLLGVLACFVGVFVAQPVVFTAVALAYRHLQARRTAVAS